MSVAQAVAHFNPRYVCYAQVHERDPEQMLAFDAERFPGGKMAGFLIWMGHRWSEYRHLRGLSATAPLSDADHDDFMSWLERKVSDPLARFRLRV